MAVPGGRIATPRSAAAAQGPRLTSCCAAKRNREHNHVGKKSNEAPASLQAAVPPPQPQKLTIAGPLPPATAPAAAPPDDSNTSALPGIIPQSSTIPSSPVDYFRTAWNGESGVGKGFVRETSQYRPSALEFDAAPPEDIVTSQNQRFSVINKASEFAESLQVGAGVSVEAYGASLSASVDISKNTQFSSNSVTISLLRSYKSDPIIFVDPVASAVKLSDTAKETLQSDGPKAFHEKYGTHYVAGYTIGGLFSGFVQKRYADSATAESSKIEVEAAFGKFGIQGKLNVNIDKEVSESTSESSTRASYAAIGWNVGPTDFSGGIRAPGTVVDMATLLEAADSMETDNGERLEAVLGLYEDLQDYQEATREHYNPSSEYYPNLPDIWYRQPAPPPTDGSTDFESLPKDKFIVISQLLNTEFLCLDFLDRVIGDTLLAMNKNPDAESLLHGLRVKAFHLQQQIKDKFSINNDARDNWLALADYIDTVKDCALTPGCSHDPNEPILGDDGEPTRADTGRLLANAIFECESLQGELDTLLKAQNVTFPTPKVSSN